MEAPWAAVKVWWWPPPKARNRSFVTLYDEHLRVGRWKKADREQIWQQDVRDAPPTQVLLFGESGSSKKCEGKGNTEKQPQVLPSRPRPVCARVQESQSHMAELTTMSVRPLCG